MEPVPHGGPPAPLTEAECANFFGPLMEDVRAELAARLARAQARHGAALHALEFAESAIEEGHMRGSDPGPARDALVTAQRDFAATKDECDRLARRAARLDQQESITSH